MVRYKETLIFLCVDVCVHSHISLDSVYGAVEVQTATHQTNSCLRSDPTLVNTDKEKSVIQLSISTILLQQLDTISLSYLDRNTEMIPTSVVTETGLTTPFQSQQHMLHSLYSFSPDTESSLTALQQFHKVFNPV